MTNGEFRQWLRGFFELSEGEVSLDAKQLQIIANHLNLAEAVEGKLDALNTSLRAVLLEFRSRAVHEDGEIDVLVSSIRNKIFQE